MPPIYESDATQRSLIRLPFALAAFSLFALAAFSASARAQGVGAESPSRSARAGGQGHGVEAKLQVVSLAPPRVRVEGRRGAGATAWSFRNAYAGMLGLAERIENFSLADERGAAVNVRKLAAGEYEAERPASAFAYEVRLDPPSDMNGAAHVSWLAAGHGVLMLGDLLPLPAQGARLRLILPAGWESVTPPASADLAFATDDAESAVFLVGRGVRRHRAGVKGAELTVAFAGDWAFQDQEAVELVAQIVNEHAQAFGVAPRARAQVIIAPHPRPATPGQWSAEARGGTVTLLTGRAPTRQSALARLAGPLAHEIFHLWVPNGLRLAGDYDWFYEGFAVYQALRVGVRLGQLNFNDYLDALARAYDGYRRESARDDVSLVAASSRRWSGANALVYQKGALTAFLYDLELRRRTGGKRTLDDALRELFRRAARGTASRDGNAFAADSLDAALGDSSFTQRYVKAVHKINLAEELRPHGLSAMSDPARTRIVVSESLSDRQRALLRQIGYN